MSANGRAAAAGPMIGANPARAISPPSPETFTGSASTAASCGGWSAICSRLESPSFWNTKPRASEWASASQRSSWRSTVCGRPSDRARSAATRTSASPVELTV
jgi:hypothetical protein